MYIQDNVSQSIFILYVKLNKLSECMKNHWACFIRDIHHIALGFKHLWSRFWTHGRWLALTKFAPTEAPKHPCESMWIHANPSKFIKTYQEVTHQANTVYWEFSIICCAQMHLLSRYLFICPRNWVSYKPCSARCTASKGIIEGSSKSKANWIKTKQQKLVFTVSCFHQVQFSLVFVAGNSFFLTNSYKYTICYHLSTPGNVQICWSHLRLLSFCQLAPCLAQILPLPTEKEVHVHAMRHTNRNQIISLIYQ